MICKLKSTLTNFVLAYPAPQCPAMPILLLRATPNPPLLARPVSSVPAKPVSPWPVSPVSPMPVKPVLPIPAKSVIHLPAQQDQLVPACAQWSQFHCYPRSRISNYLETQFHPNHQSTIQPYLAVCSQQSQLHPFLQMQINHYQGRQFHPYLWNKIPPYLVAPIKTRPTTSWLLPLSPDPLLPAKTVSPIPVKPDSPLSACSKQGQIVRDVRVSMSEQWDQACQSGETKHVGGVRQSMSELWKLVCQSCKSKHISCESEHVRVGGVKPNPKLLAS